MFNVNIAEVYFRPEDNSDMLIFGPYSWTDKTRIAFVCPKGRPICGTLPRGTSLFSNQV